MSVTKFSTLILNFKELWPRTHIPTLEKPFLLTKKHFVIEWTSSLRKKFCFSQEIWEVFIIKNKNLITLNEPIQSTSENWMQLGGSCGFKPPPSEKSHWFKGAWPSALQSWSRIIRRPWGRRVETDKFHSRLNILRKIQRFSTDGLTTDVRSTSASNNRQRRQRYPLDGQQRLASYDTQKGSRCVFGASEREEEERGKDWWLLWCW